MSVRPPSPPYVPARHYGGAQTVVKRIVVHGTVSPTVRGGAAAIARYFAGENAPTASAHYVVDPWETRQCVLDHRVAYHAPPNEGSIGIEQCDPVAGSPGRWYDRAHRKMTRRTGRLIGRLHASGVYVGPLVKVNGDALRHNGGVGVCGHSDVRDAWHQTTHWDPNMPAAAWARIMRIARRRSRYLTRRDAVARAITGKKRRK